MTNIIFYSFFAGSSKYNHKFKAVYNIENEETAFRFTVNLEDLASSICSDET